MLKTRPSFLFILFHSTCLCDELIFVAGSGGEDFGVLLLHLMFIVDPVLWFTISNVISLNYQCRTSQT